MTRAKEMSERSAKDDSSQNPEDYEDEYEVYVVEDEIESSRTTRFKQLENEFVAVHTASQIILTAGFFNRIRSLFIDPRSGWYQAWTKFILLWAVYSSFFTPMEFGFYRGLPDSFKIFDQTGQLTFIVDIVLQFFVPFRDSQTYRMVYRHSPIALRYFKSTFVFDLLSCFPWDGIYKACGRKEEVRYLLWIRLTRFRFVFEFFNKMEKDIRFNYMVTRIAKLIVIEAYCTHTAACIFYYLATTLPETEEGYTWIGSLTMGDFSYARFRDIDLLKRYITSLYFAIVTLTSVGYGDIHAVNLREMTFVMMYMYFDMLLFVYLTGNMTAIIVKGSKTEKFRDKMTEVITYMNRNRLGRDLRRQIKGHVRLQYESDYTEAVVLQDFPVSIRANISQSLYLPLIQKVPLLRGCSPEFINQLIPSEAPTGMQVVGIKRGHKNISRMMSYVQLMVSKLREEFYLPGQVVIEQGNVVDQIYFVCLGVLEEVGIDGDGSQVTVAFLLPNSSFGQLSILCNIPQPCSVRVCELCRLLRLDKQSFTSILEIYFHDYRKIFKNLLKEKKSNLRLRQLESEITLRIGKQEAELALRVNNAAYHGELYLLKSLVRVGADPCKADYDGRTPLHLAASRGFEHVVQFLIQEGVNIDSKDNHGHTPILEAIRNGHDRVASLLLKEGALMKIDDAGSYLCNVVAKGDTDFLKRLLSNGVDPDSKSYDERTPLHVAASAGQYWMAKVLVDSGASVFLKDRWGNTPIDESRMSGNRNLIKLLEDAKSAQLVEFPYSSQESSFKLRPRKCTVFPFHPWDDDKGHKRPGVVLWVPHTIGELIEKSAENLEISGNLNCYILSEEGGKILDVDMIDDGQKLYLVRETH